MAVRRAKRVALLGLHLESNAFAPPTTEEDFRACCYLVGEEITAEAAKPHPAMPMEMAAFVAGMNAAGPWEPAPILLTGAEPGGPVQEPFLGETLAAMEAGLRSALPLDGVYLSNHGAMTSASSLDPDGDMFRMVRGVVGPEVPVVATLDLHANISHQMVEQTDVLISYLKNPHTDQEERGREAARVLGELMGGLRPKVAFLPLPLVPVQTSLLTAEGPYAELINYGRQRLGSEILNVSVLGGFSYGDTPKQGLSVVVTARSSLSAARALAREIAGQAWENRRRFTRTFPALEEVVALAKRTGDDPALPPHIIADVSDNPGGGARSNTTWVLEAFHRAGVRGALLGNFYDPPLARRAHELGEGTQFDALFNAEETEQYSRRLELPAKVIALAEGPVVGTRGIYAGRTLDLGPCAALEVGGIRVAVVSRRIQCADPVFFQRLGLEPGDARTVVVKSRGHFRAGFDHIFPPERTLEVDTPGLTSQNLANFPYRNLTGSRFPFDPDARWEPPDWARK